MAVITTSGALVTLLLALLTVKGRGGATVATGATDSFALGVWLLLVAGVAALVTNLPLRYASLDAGALQGIIEERWSDSPAAATRRVTATRLRTVARSHRLNSLKARFLVAALLAEVGGITALGLAVRSSIGA